MARVTATAGEWTTVPDTGGAMLLEARFHGVYVDTSGTPPVDPKEGYALSDGTSWVISAGVVVNVWPMRSVDAELFAHLA